MTFYLKYAYRSLKRGGQRTFFAILCIAVGVAAIVALQSTGLAIQNSVSGDAKANARADVLVTSRQFYFLPEDLKKFDQLINAKTILDYTYSNNSNGLTITKPDGTQSNEFNSYYVTYAVNPAKYPFYGKLELTNGKKFSEALNGSNQIVLSTRMAKSLGAKVGDKVKAVGTNQTAELTVAGILSDQTLTPPVMSGGQADFTGYAYTNFETARSLFKAESLLPETVYIKTDSVVGADDKAATAIKNLSSVYAVETSTNRNAQVKQATNGISDMLMYVGLLSLLIGSVGVVNTMLVVIGRRSTEIATVKALGLEQGQTVRLFLVESAILGVLGSVAGIFLGLLLSLVTSGAAQGFINQSLEFQFYWQPLVMGFIVGVVTATVFGLLPAYSAGKIPPAQVLRQKTTALPKISFGATVVIILIMTVVMGGLAGVVLNGQIGLGLVLAFGVLVGCGLLVLLFAGILWLVGIIPLPLGLNYGLARRNLSRGRAKQAVTMLVMTVGIFSVALVIILASSLKDTVQNIIQTSFGYNVRIVAQDTTQSAQIVSALDGKQIGGLERYNILSQGYVRMVSAGGKSVEELISQRLKDSPNNQANSFMQYDFGLVLGVSPDKVPGLARMIDGKIYADTNTAIINKTFRDSYGIKIGDELIYQDTAQSKQFSVKVVGVFEDKNVIVSLGSVAVSNELVQTLPGHITQFDLTVSKDQAAAAVSTLQSKFTGASVYDLSFFSTVINRIIDNVTAFPVLLAFLCLIAGAILIANNVALAVLERRTEMGVMKSVGADSTRVLSIINWETSLVSFLGGVLGLLTATVVASILISVFGTAENPAVLSLSPAIYLGMPALAVGLTILATLVSAWGAAREKPMVVLRYE
jgi:putative ABC transport system permease protein